MMGSLDPDVIFHVTVWIRMKCVIKMMGIVYQGVSLALQEGIVNIIQVCTPYRNLTLD